MQLQPLRAISPQPEEQHAQREQCDVQTARLDGFCRELPLKLQHSVLAVQGIELQLVGDVLVRDFLIGQVTRADIVEIAFVRDGILLVIGQGCLVIGAALGELVERRVGVDQRLGVFVRHRVLDGIQAELLRQRRRALALIRLGQQRVVLRDQAAVA